MRPAIASVRPGVPHADNHALYIASFYILRHRKRRLWAEKYKPRPRALRGRGWGVYSFMLQIDNVCSARVNAAPCAIPFHTVSDTAPGLCVLRKNVYLGSRHIVLGPIPSPFFYPLDNKARVRAASLVDFRGRHLFSSNRASILLLARVFLRT